MVERLQRTHVFSFHPNPDLFGPPIIAVCRIRSGKRRGVLLSRLPWWDRGMAAREWRSMRSLFVRLIDEEVKESNRQITAFLNANPTASEHDAPMFHLAEEYLDGIGHER